MRPSTLAELVGFVAISYAVFRLDFTAGLAVAGALLLLIAYAFEDDTAIVSIVRMVAPFKIRWETHKVNRHARKAARLEQKSSRRGRFYRPPQEVVLNIKSH